MSVVCRYVSHLEPGGSDWSTWQPAPRLHSSRAAGRAAGSSALLSFLRWAHIHGNTHLLLSAPHFSLGKKKNLRMRHSRNQRLASQVVSDKQSHAGPVSQPRDPDSELVGTCGWNIASQRLERVCAVMWGVWKVESRSHSEEQQQEATFSELCLLRLSPIDDCCAAATPPPGGDKLSLSWKPKGSGRILCVKSWLCIIHSDNNQGPKCVALENLIIYPHEGIFLSQDAFRSNIKVSSWSYFILQLILACSMCVYFPHYISSFRCI